MKLKIIVYIIVFLEGGALLSYEIISAKIYTPYIGSTIHVWTSILTITLLSLGFSYRFSHYFISKNKWGVIPVALLSSSIYLIGVLIFKDSLLSMTVPLEIKKAAITLGLLLLFIPIYAMGLVTPTISAFLSLKASDSQNEIGKISGVLYAIGTFSGVLFTLLFIYFIIPQLGVMTAVILISFLLLIASIMAYFVTYKWK